MDKSGAGPVFSQPKVGPVQVSLSQKWTRSGFRSAKSGPGVTVYFIPRIFYPGDSIYYPADNISLVYFIPRQDILSLHGDHGMSQNISVATQSRQQSSSQSVLTEE